VQVHEMALVDARRCGVDDDEHFRGKIVTAAIEDHARDVNGFSFLWMRAFVKVKRSEAMLAVNDEEFFFWLLQMADGLVSVKGLETQLLRREKEHGSWDGWLVDGRFVEIADRLYLRTRKGALEGFFTALNLRDELGHVVLWRNSLRLDLFPFVV